MKTAVVAGHMSGMGGVPFEAAYSAPNLPSPALWRRDTRCSCGPALSSFDEKTDD